MEAMRGVITRDLVELGGLPERLALPLAEFAAASVVILFEGSRVNFRSALLAQARDRKMRELNRRALANVHELVDLTGLDRSHVYRILRAKVAGARRPKP